jgi:hypothetical protein
MVIKYTNIYQSKALQNLPNFGFFGLKKNHLATLLLSFERFLGQIEFKMIVSADALFKSLNFFSMEVLEPH